MTASLEDVSPEVALEVAPDAVDVRAAVARVVELEQKGGPLQPVVVGPAWAKASEMNTVRSSESSSAQSASV